MKKYILQIIVMFSIFNCHAQTHTFSIINPLSIKRQDELVVIKRSDIEKYFRNNMNDFHYEITSAKKKINFQNVDLNNDEHWDELVFLASFKPNEKKDFTIESVINQKSFRSNFSETFAHVRMKPKNKDNSFGESITCATMPYQNSPNDFAKNPLPPYLTEGPAWENDKVAFRLYFDTRNTIDIYGK
ncbi:MAG: DUF4861 family protein, partial [Parafilimonas sp.]